MWRKITVVSGIVLALSSAAFAGGMGGMPGMGDDMGQSATPEGDSQARPAEAPKPPPMPDSGTQPDGDAGSPAAAPTSPDSAPDNPAGSTPAPDGSQQ
jgi:hypothetical protein